MVSPQDLGLFSGSAEGVVETTSNHSLVLGVNSNEKLRIGAAGQIGIAGANYGTSGQVLTSQGASSAVQWAAVPTWTQESIATVQSGTEYEFTGIPATAREIMIQFNGISFQ